MFTTEDKVRIVSQVSELWARDMAPDGSELVAVRFDTSRDPYKTDEDGWYTDSICLIFIDGEGYGPYVYTWTSVSVDEDTNKLQFTEDDWESWSQSGVEPYRCDYNEYMDNKAKDEVDHPEWDTVYITPSES